MVPYPPFVVVVVVLVDVVVVFAGGADCDTGAEQTYVPPGPGIKLVQPVCANMVLGATSDGVSKINAIINAKTLYFKGMFFLHLSGKRDMSSKQKVGKHSSLAKT